METEGTFFNIVKAIYHKSMVNIILSENDSLLSNIRHKARLKVLVVLDKTIRQERDSKNT